MRRLIDYNCLFFFSVNIGTSCQNKEGCCTEDRPCGLLEGTCLRDAQCRDGLKCGRSGCPGDGTCCNKRGNIATM